jgi:SAM-dependent methyltransferase
MITEVFDYDTHGLGYVNHRQPDPSIQKMINEALGEARTVINVGAGAGSYEPTDRYVVAIEPSAVMRGQRPAHLAPAINAFAESLPFDDESFDASMAILTIHHWKDKLAGLKEMRRVTRGPVVIFTYDARVVHEFWFSDYSPEIIETDNKRFPPIELILETLGGNAEVNPISVPLNCTDGFHEAYYGRPESFLDPRVRNSQSSWPLLPPGAEERIVKKLASDLETGEWDKKYGQFRTQPEFIGALRLIIALP